MSPARPPSPPYKAPGSPLDLAVTPMVTSSSDPDLSLEAGLDDVAILALLHLLLLLLSLYLANYRNKHRCSKHVNSSLHILPGPHPPIHIGWTRPPGTQGPQTDQLYRPLAVTTNIFMIIFVMRLPYSPHYLISEYKLNGDPHHPSIPPISSPSRLSI